jgi:hypothetical protein
MYLLHSILMRSVLVWVVYGLISLPEGQTRRIVVTVVFGLWMGLLIYLSVLWRDRLDGACVVFTKWAEDVMLGKNHLSGSLISIRTKLLTGFTSAHPGSGHGDRDLEMKVQK